MNTLKTLNEARVNVSGIVTIVKINHKIEGEVFIKIKCSMLVLKKALAQKPVPEIINLIAEYAIYNKSKTKKINNRNGIDMPCKYCGTYCYGDCRG